MVKREVKKVVIPASKNKFAAQKANKRFISQGAVTESANTLATSFVVPFAQQIGSTAFHIGILSAFTGLLAPIGGLFGSKLMERKSRKTISLFYTWLEALIWIPIIAIPFLYWQGFALSSLPYLLILLFSFFVFFTGVKIPPIFSWMGDLVEEKERGKYFGKRNRVIGLYGLVIFLIGGLVLRYFEARGLLLESIIGILIFAIILKIVSVIQLKHVYCPQFTLHKKSEFTFWEFIKKKTVFQQFTIFQALLNFSIMIASPFFAVYMLEDLNFNILTFTIITISSTAFYLVLTPLVGKFSDKYGNAKLLIIAGISFPLTPLLWVINQNPVYLTLVPGFVAGLANAALTIGSTNFTYDLVTPQKRGICVAYSGVVSGLGIFAGSILGGLLIEYLTISFMNTTLFVFLLAAIIRFLVILLFISQLKEIRKVKQIKGLSVNVLHPFKTINSDIVWFKKFINEK